MEDEVGVDQGKAGAASGGVACCMWVGVGAGRGRRLAWGNVGNRKPLASEETRGELG